jgi:Na+/melibiose symporter-like transporter
MTDPTLSYDPAPGPAAGPVYSTDDAMRSVQRGVLAGYLMSAMNVIGAGLVYFTGYSVNASAGDDRTIIAASTLLMAAIASALAYRFGRTHSVGIPIILLAWLCFEAIAKLLDRGPSAISVVIFALVAFGLGSGLYGALALRKTSETSKSSNMA